MQHAYNISATLYAITYVFASICHRNLSKKMNSPDNFHITNITGNNNTITVTVNSNNQTAHEAGSTPVTEEAVLLKEEESDRSPSGRICKTKSCLLLIPHDLIPDDQKDITEEHTKKCFPYNGHFTTY